MSTYFQAFLEKKIDSSDYDYKFLQYVLQLANICPDKNRKLKAVDLGCGRGTQVKLLNELGFDCIGIDSSASPGTNIIIDFRSDQLPFESNSIDFFYSKSLFEHLYINEQQHLLEEVKRCLRPGGTLITIVPDYQTCSHVFHHAWSHVHPFTRVSLSRMFILHGFKNGRVIRVHQLPITWKKGTLASVARTLSSVIRALKVSTPPLAETQNWLSSYIRWSRELQLVGFARKDLLSE